VRTIEVYKVVRRSGDKLQSALIYDQRFIVDYVPGKPTKPKHPGSLLYAFKDLKSAVRFMGSNCLPGHEVWVCQAIPSRRKPKAANCTALFTRFWNLFTRRKDIPRLVLGLVPPGCILCSEITLVRRVARFQCFDGTDDEPIVFVDEHGRNPK